MRIIIFVGKYAFRLEKYNGNSICDNCVSHKANFVLKQAGSIEKYLCFYCFKTLKNEVMNRLFNFINNYINRELEK